MFLELETKRLKHLKIKLLFNFEDGFFFLIALFLVSLSYLVYSNNNLLKIVLSILFMIYFICLIWHRYRINKSIFLIISVIFSFAFWRDRIDNSLTMENIPQIKVYPDEVKIKDNWLSGIGHVRDQKISLTGNASDKAIYLLKNFKTISFEQVDGEIKEIECATNEGQFDFKKYYYAKNISQGIKLSTYQVIAEKDSLLSRLHGLRAYISEKLSHLPRLLAFFTSELVLASNPSADNQINLDNYRDLGVIHILSISGMHVGLYVLILSTVCYSLFLTEEETFFICTLFLFFEIFLSGFQAGFIRASLTYVLERMSQLLKFEIAGADILGLTLIVHLFFCPRLLLSIGALLSYVLVLGMQLTKNMSEIKQSALLNLLLTPFLLMYFYQINFLTILYNFFVVPYFNWIVMPVAFISIVFIPFNNVLNLLESILEFTEGILTKISELKFGMITFGKIVYWQSLLIFVLTIFVLIYRKNNFIKKLYIMLATIYFLLFINIHFPLQGRVTFIDVGQGDSILITTPIFRKVYLIDTGGKVNFSGKKQSTPQVEKITIPFLKSQGISKIDAVFVSHQDADHVGDLGPLLEKIQVKKLYMAKGIINNPNFRKRIVGKVNHTQLIELLGGMQVNEAIKFDVVHPWKTGEGANEDSLSLICKINGKIWGFTGDLDQAGELDIIRRNPSLHVDYFKLGHHGSDTSSNADFLKTISPKMVFISAGRNNRYGHPKPATLETLKNLNIPYLSTQDCGMISWYYNLKKQDFYSFLKGKLS